QIGPASGHSKRRIIVVLEVSNGVPSGHVFPRTVWCYPEVELAALTVADDEHALAMLRHSEIRCIELSHSERVVRMSLSIDVAQAPADEGKPFVLALEL